MVWYAVLEKQLQIKISSALLFLFIQRTTKNKTTFDGSAATECAPAGVQRVFLCPSCGNFGR